MVFSTLSQSFSFHSSPESFISTRLQDLAVSDPELLPSGKSENKIITASILNRNVHIVSSYQLCKDILEASWSARSSSHTPRTIRPASASATVASGGNGNPGTNGKASSLPDDTFVAGPAYDQLMSDFFPLPNILLEDGPSHATHKQAWMDQLSSFPADTASHVRKIAKKHARSLLEPTTGSRSGNGKTIDLYDSLKSLAWEVLLGIFLNISPSSSSSSSPSPSSASPSILSTINSSSTPSTNASSSDDFSTIESLQETLLRGQFSLFPVSIRAPGVWQSPRSKGIKARRDLQGRFRETINRQAASTCPYLQQSKVSREDAASHALLFTSSIAVKALASLLTAFVLNLFLWRDGNSDHDGSNDSNEQRVHRGESTSAPPSPSLAELVRSQVGDTDAAAAGATDRKAMLQSILQETERLSPPVIGVMRRTKHDILLSTDTTQPQASDHHHHQPAEAATAATASTPPNSNPYPAQAGTDIWLYLPAACRDRTVFGADAESFRWDRYITSASSSSPPTPAPLAYGTGPKSCLGTPLIRQLALLVGEVLLEEAEDGDGDGGDSTVVLQMQGEVLDKGVRAWLGWEGSAGANADADADATVRAEQVAKGMKQLPVQRPREPVSVKVYGVRSSVARELD